MACEDEEQPADEQFPVVDPELIRDALRALKLPRGFRPGGTAASVTVNLTATQVNLLLWRARQRPHKLEGDAALKDEIESLISVELTDGLRRMHECFNPWLHLIQMAKLGSQRERLKRLVQRKDENGDA